MLLARYSQANKGNSDAKANKGMKMLLRMKCLTFEQKFNKNLKCFLG